MGKNMSKTLKVIILAFLIITPASRSQNINRTTNVLYFELGGNNIFYSLNYEKEVTKNLNLRFGVSIIPITELTNAGIHSNSKFFGTMMSNYLVHISKNNYLELGGGLSYGLETLFPAITLGYRYSPDNGGFIW